MMLYQTVLFTLSFMSNSFSPLMMLILFTQCDPEHVWLFMKNTMASAWLLISSDEDIVHIKASNLVPLCFLLLLSPDCYAGVAVLTHSLTTSLHPVVLCPSLVNTIFCAY